ncbi:MAG: ribonuclease HII [Pseudomonadota bacterium]
MKKTATKTTRSKAHQTQTATYRLEREAHENGAGLVAGVDEAGRGPWAGPVVAAAVILDASAIPIGIADSKALDEQKREALFEQITSASQVGIGIADVERIDRDNILAATMWAMGEAVAALALAPDIALIDGNRAPPLTCQARTIIKGDAICLSIAAASIIAKVTRDRILRDLGKAHPEYGFEKHKGYGTKQHQAALRTHGVTPHHRRSFKPIKALIGNTVTGPGEMERPNS